MYCLYDPTTPSREYIKLQYQYHKLNRKKKKLIKYYKYKEEQRIIALIQNSTDNAKYFWRLLHNTRPVKRKSITVLLDEDEKEVIDITAQCELLHQHFDESIKDIEKYDEKCMHYHNEIENEFALLSEDDSSVPVNEYLSILNDPINKYELLKNIRDLHNDKSMGHDAIHNQFIKRGQIFFIQFCWIYSILFLELVNIHIYGMKHILCLYQNQIVIRNIQKIGGRYHYYQ